MQKLNNKQIKTIKELGKLSHEYPLIAELINNMQKDNESMKSEIEKLKTSVGWIQNSVPGSI